MDYPIYPCGDSALTVKVGNGISEEIHRRVFALFSALEQAYIPGVTELVPTYDSLCVHFDPAVVSPMEMVSRLKAFELFASAETPALDGRLVRIPVCYGGTYGPDLQTVAQHAGMREEDVIRLHSGTTYLTYMLGFLPGFCYLGGLDPRIHTPRLANPRIRIRQGSVGIGGSQTGIYPMDSPGDWQLMGMTPVKTYDPKREVPILVNAGEYIRFIPITGDEFLQIKDEVDRGTYKVKVSSGEV